MSATRYLRFALLAICLSVTVSSYGNAQVSGEGGPVSNGFAQDLSHNTSSLASAINSPLSAGQPGLPGSKYGGGGELNPVEPPLPPVPNPIPEPNVLLDLGVGLCAFATLWNFRMRRRAQ